MTLGQFLGLLIVAGIAGSLGQAIVGYSHGGCFVSIALGFVGALLGSWLAGLLGLPAILDIRIGHESFPLVWSIAGAALFVAILRFLSRPRPPRRPPA